MTNAAPAPATKPAHAGTAVARVRTSATRAVDAATGSARELARKTAESVDANPVAILAGGVALGILAGAFMPRTEQETKLLRPVGKRLADTARGAIDAAKDTATSQFDVLGLTRNAARDQVGKLIGDVVKALAVAGTAALTAAKASPAPVPSPVPIPTPKKPASKKAKPAA